MTTRTYFRVEGRYVDRARHNRLDKTPWQRTWLTWIDDIHSLKQATLTKRNGDRILDPDSFTGFDQLRIVKVEETVTVLDA
jgi:hypothetical protein